MDRFMGKSFVLFLLVASLSGATFLSPKRDVGSVAGTTAGAMSLAPEARFGQTLAGSNEFRQYTAGGHVLGFREDGVVIASGSHALRVDFVNARPVSPAEEGTPSGHTKGQGRAQELVKVTYRELWDGVSVDYEKTESGLVKSTYRVHPGGAKATHPVDEIRLHYNVPVRVDESGNLVLTLATEEICETRPVAWQEIGGERASVEVGFRLLGDREVGFRAGACDSRYALVIDPVLIWDTFLGGTSEDYGSGIAVDTSGNIYVTGASHASWGSPVRAFEVYGTRPDAFVAKLNGSGVLQWNTFLGGIEYDYGTGIAVDTIGNVYVNGYSHYTWGTPVDPWSADTDAFVAKLDGNGVLQWNSFLGGIFWDDSRGVALDTSGNVYVTGESDSTWGTPVNPNNEGAYDAFVAKLNGSGVLQWNTFLGGLDDDNGNSIATDMGGNVYVTGTSGISWGTPVNPHSGADDAFVAKLNGNGVLQWNTFLGGADTDWGQNIAVDTSGNVYVTGYGVATWGTPINPFSGGGDGFVAELDGNGVRQWNTFLGGTDFDIAYGIAVGTSGNVYVTGYGAATWGTPVNPFSGGGDAFVAELDGNGVRRWNTFLGGTNSEYGVGIAVDIGGNLFVIGDSPGTWGLPVRPFAGGYDDAFVAKIGSGIRTDFNMDGQEDILWRYYGEGGYNRAWFLGDFGQAGLPLIIGQSDMAAVSTGGRSAEARAVSKTTKGSRAMGMMPGRSREKPQRMPRNLMGDRRRAGSAMVHDPRLAGGSYSRPSPAGTSDPRLVGLALNPATSTDGIVKVAAAPVLLGGADVMPVGDLTWKVVGTGDLNNDTHVDILWRNDSSGSNVVWFMNGTEWTASAELLPVGDLNWQIVGTGDFNKDAHVDILWRNSSSGENVVWYMNGTEWIGSAMLLGVSDPSWQIVGTGDFNKDGNVDILWRYNGAGGYNVVWYMSGASWAGSAELIHVGDLTWQIVGTGDYNNDGNVDILWRYNGVGGYNVIWYMEGVAWSESAELLPVADLTWRIVSR